MMWIKKLGPFAIAAGMCNAKIKSARYRAMLAGEPTYIGSPCKICGNTVRQVSGANCAVCHKRHRDNKKQQEKLVMRKRRYYEDHLHDILLARFGISIICGGKQKHKNKDDVVLCYMREGKKVMYNLTQGTRVVLPDRVE